MRIGLARENAEFPGGRVASRDVALIRIVGNPEFVQRVFDERPNLQRQRTRRSIEQMNRTLRRREIFENPDDRYMNGRLPAYEWASSDANPPVHACMRNMA